MKYVSAWVVTAAVAALWTGFAFAQARPGMFAASSAANAKRMTPDQREERRFLKDAAATSRFESDASRLALTKSSNAQVRSFAATLINHNTSAAAVLQHMLHGRGMAPPMLSTDQRKALNRLAKLNGKKFDREFMDQVGLKHQQNEVDYYEKASVAARDPALKGWIDSTLPTLRNHLSTAERIATPDSRLAKTAPTPGVTKPVSARTIESNTR